MLVIQDAKIAQIKDNSNAKISFVDGKKFKTLLSAGQKYMVIGKLWNNGIENGNNGNNHNKDNLIAIECRHIKRYDRGNVGSLGLADKTPGKGRFIALNASVLKWPTGQKTVVEVMAPLTIQNFIIEVIVRCEDLKTGGLMVRQFNDTIIRLPHHSFVLPRGDPTPVDNQYIGREHDRIIKTRAKQLLEMSTSRVSMDIPSSKSSLDNEVSGATEITDDNTCNMDTMSFGSVQALSTPMTQRLSTPNVYNDGATHLPGRQHLSACRGMLAIPCDKSSFITHKGMDCCNANSSDRSNCFKTVCKQSHCNGLHHHCLSLSNSSQHGSNCPKERESSSTAEYGSLSLLEPNLLYLRPMSRGGYVAERIAHKVNHSDPKLISWIDRSYDIQPLILSFHDTICPVCHCCLQGMDKESRRSHLLKEAMSNGSFLGKLKNVLSMKIPVQYTKPAMSNKTFHEQWLSSINPTKTVTDSKAKHSIPPIDIRHTIQPTNTNTAKPLKSPTNDNITSKTSSSAPINEIDQGFSLELDD